MSTAMAGNEPPSGTTHLGAVPERVGNYQIVSKLGEGGMGAVYLARHDFMDRTAAVKFLHPHLCGDPKLVQRFLNEARAANAIRHENIIEVIDTGLALGSGIPYLLMERLVGESLASRLAAGPLSLKEAIAMAAQVASALAAAHAAGIVHRDLKPENLFLCARRNQPPLVKVLDFGIAKLRRTLAGSGFETEQGAFVGTPRYMSPEQCHATGEVDHRTDIYSLGIILFEMVCGRPPFVASSTGQLIVEHMMTAPPRARSLNPQVPEALDEIVARALKKSPAERQASMEELRADLAAIPLADLPEGLAPRAAAALPSGFAVSPTEPAATTGATNAPARAVPQRTDVSTLSSSATMLRTIDADLTPRRGRPALIAGLALVGIAGAIWFALPRSTSPAPNSKAGQSSSAKPKPEETPPPAAVARKESAAAMPDGGAVASGKPTVTGSPSSPSSPAGVQRPAAKAKTKPKAPYEPEIW